MFENFIIVICILVAVAAIWVGITTPRELKKKQTDWENDNTERSEKARRLVNFPIAHICECAPSFPNRQLFANNGEWFLAVELFVQQQHEYGFLFADAHLQNFVYLKYGRDDNLLSSLQFMSSHIIAVDLTDGLKTTHTVTNSTSKSNGGLTRAAIGGLAFGGVGAIVGGVTAGQKTTGTSTTEEKFGDVTLRIATTSPDLPIIAINVPLKVGRDWMMLIQRLLAMRNQRPTPPLQQQQFGQQKQFNHQRHAEVANGDCRV